MLIIEEFGGEGWVWELSILSAQFCKPAPAVKNNLIKKQKKKQFTCSATLPGEKHPGHCHSSAGTVIRPHEYLKGYPREHFYV